MDRKICIIGMGYVGLTLGTAMAECGFDVVGVEINPKTLESLVSGKAHFYEVGLNQRLARQIEQGRIRFTGDINSDEAKACTTFVITVGTPLDPNTHQPRMDMVERAATQVAGAMPDDSLIILRSTVRIGTTRRVALPALQASGKKFDLAYCPERTLEGRALEELRSLPQVVGGLTPESAWRATEIFQRITPTTIRVSRLEAAELVKLLDNSFRDLFFSFGNEVALLCEAAGLDAMEVLTAANTGYVRTNIAKPGFVGGPCLEKDPHILAHSMQDFNFVPKLVTTGRALNEDLPGEITKVIINRVPASTNGGKLKISVCGLAFKGQPETDDMRGTPSLILVDQLRKAFPDATLYGQDFAVNNAVIEESGLIPVDVAGAFKDAHIVVIANNNAKYQWVPLDTLLDTMARPGVLYDAWNCLQGSGATPPQGVEYLKLGCSSATLSSVA